ncbi:hypothetical protein CN128_07465 [Sinorhizobium meliloti]|uniref:DUF6339 family protein n=1 Tax=Rhizobium meliloti TaxID=382 RepID=UPI000FD97690|nr:DUF6339 family protein [Sinorhizobium meliloti]RVM58878.1 hypothetical protein CN128_07465 [Sinorhizobium meliloti]
MTAPLKYLSDAAISQLRGDISKNVERYRKTGFSDRANEPGWDIPLGIDYDNEKLATLDLSQPAAIAAIDLQNSKIVGEALSGLDPSTANEERIWVRLAHVEAFDYSRARWIRSASDHEIPALARDHFFASTQTGIRDDQSLSRLWWNYQIARTCQPDDIDWALNLILKRADIRSNFVERIWMTSRRNIAAAVLRAMATDPWVTGQENNFRDFMKAVNRLGGGVVFEALNEKETDAFVSQCVALAKAA